MSSYNQEQFMMCNSGNSQQLIMSVHRLLSQHSHLSW